MKNYFKSLFVEHPSPLRVCWWPNSKRGKLYSSQARAWWHIDFLTKNFSDISIKPYGNHGDVLILQKPVRIKVRDRVQSSLKNFSLVIFDLSDLVADLEMDKAIEAGFLTLDEFREFSQEADFFVVNGIGLQKWVEKELHRPAIIIEDSYHVDYDLRMLKKHVSQKPLPVWHGGGKQAALFIEGVLNEPDQLELKLDGREDVYLGDLNDISPGPITIFSNKSYFDVSSKKSSIYKEHPQYPKLFRELLNYDIGVVPYWPWNKYCAGKSSNKADAMMLVGLPVIATPIPELNRLIDHGVSGFLCTTKKEWEQAFEDLRDPELRESVGLKGRSKVLEERSVPFLACRWRKVLFESVV